MTPEEMEKKTGQLIAKAWADEGFKKRLIANPTEVYKEFGFDVPKEVAVKVVENTDKIFHFVLPPKPSDELSDEALDGAAGGAAGNIKRNLAIILPGHHQGIDPLKYYTYRT